MGLDYVDVFGISDCYYDTRVLSRWLLTRLLDVCTILPLDLFAVMGRVYLEDKLFREVLVGFTPIREFDLLRVSLECLFEIRKSYSFSFSDYCMPVYVLAITTLFGICYLGASG